MRGVFELLVLLVAMSGCVGEERESEMFMGYVKRGCVREWEDYGEGIVEWSEVRMRDVMPMEVLSMWVCWKSIGGNDVCEKPEYVRWDEESGEMVVDCMTEMGRYEDELGMSYAHIASRELDSIELYMLLE